MTIKLDGQKKKSDINSNVCSLHASAVCLHRREGRAGKELLRIF